MRNEILLFLGFFGLAFGFSLLIVFHEKDYIPELSLAMMCISAAALANQFSKKP